MTAWWFLTTCAEIHMPQKKDLLGDWWRKFPWWLVIVAIIGATVVLSMLTSEGYIETLDYLLQGVSVTIMISFAAYATALLIGLALALGRVSGNVFINNLATLYIEVARGIPLLVVIIYVHFVVGPIFGLNRNPIVSGILALSLGYGAYLAEVYRAGIESVERGQVEAARSLGMSYRTAMRSVVLPQAVRTVLPALGNDLIAMLKDSSLVSAIAVGELTKRGQIEAARTFDTFRTYNVVAVLYLALTLLSSLIVRALERSRRP